MRKEFSILCLASIFLAGCGSLNNSISENKAIDFGEPISLDSAYLNTNTSNNNTSDENNEFDLTPEVEFEEYGIVDLDEYGKIIISSDDETAIYMITKIGERQEIDCNSGFFPSYMSFSGCTVYSNSNDIYILICFKDENNEKLFMIDKDYKNFLSYVVNQDKEKNITVSITGDESMFSPLEKCYNSIVKSHESELSNPCSMELNSIEQSSTMGLLPEKIRASEGISNAILVISNNALEDNGPYYDDEAYYSYITNDNSKMLFFKAIKSSATISEVHPFIIYETGEYIDCGANRGLMKGIGGLKDLIKYDIDCTDELLIHSQSLISGETNNVWSFYNIDSREEIVFSISKDDYRIRINYSGNTQASSINYNVYQEIIQDLCNNLPKAKFADSLSLIK